MFSPTIMNIDIIIVITIIVSLYRYIIISTTSSSSSTSSSYHHHHHHNHHCHRRRHPSFDTHVFGVTENLERFDLLLGSVLVPRNAGHQHFSAYCELARILDLCRWKEGKRVNLFRVIRIRTFLAYSFCSGVRDWSFCPIIMPLSGRPMYS